MTYLCIVDVTTAPIWQLRDFFGGKEPNCAVSPEEAVAHGTAIQAAILTDRKKISVGATEAALHGPNFEQPER